MSFMIQQIYRRVFHVDDIKVLSLTLLNLTVTVSGISNPTNPTTKYRCE